MAEHRAADAVAVAAGGESIRLRSLGIQDLEAFQSRNGQDHVVGSYDLVQHSATL